MSDKFHDLAVSAATVSALKNFDVEVRGETPAERRSALADYLQDEYEYFLNYYQSKSE